MSTTAVWPLFLCLSDNSQDEFQPPLNIPPGTDKEKTLKRDFRPESEVLDYQNTSISATRPNEDIINSNSKKKVLDMDINFNNEIALDYEFKNVSYSEILLLVIYDAHLYSFCVHAIVEIKHLYYTIL